MRNLAHKILLLTLFLSLTAGFSWASKEIFPGFMLTSIDDPVKQFVNFNIPRSTKGGQIWRIQKDFNNDGLVDMAVSISSYFGTGGGPWWLFLGDEKGKFDLLKGTLAFHPKGYKLIGLKRGVGIVQGCWHISADKCRPFKEGVTTFGIQELKLSQDEVKDIKKFSEFDGPPYYEYCALSRFKSSGKCKWKEQN